MRKKWKSRLRQGTAVLLAAAMAAEGGMPAYGYIKPKSGRQTVAGNDGTGISETEDWIETFPNGVFAFKDNAVYLKEGEKKEKKLTVYRLGGRDGEATAHIAPVSYTHLSRIHPPGARRRRMPGSGHTEPGDNRRVPLSSQFRRGR